MSPCDKKDFWPEDQLDDLSDSELAAFLEHARTCPYHALMKADIEAPWHQGVAATPPSVLAELDTCATGEDVEATVTRISALTHEAIRKNQENKERWLRKGGPVIGFAVTDNVGNRVEVRIGVTSMTWDKSLNIPFDFNEVLHLVTLADGEFPEIVLETFRLDSIPADGYNYEKKLPGGVTVMCELHHMENGWSVKLDYKEAEGRKIASRANQSRGKAVGTGFSFHHLAGMQGGGHAKFQAYALVFAIVTVPLATFLVSSRSSPLERALPSCCNTVAYSSGASKMSIDHGRVNVGPTGAAGASEPCADDNERCLGEKVEVTAMIYPPRKQNMPVTKLGQREARNHPQPENTLGDVSKENPALAVTDPFGEGGNNCRLYSLATIETLSLDSHVDPELRNTMKEALVKTGRFKVISDDDSEASAHLKLTVIGGQVQAEIWVGVEQLWTDTCGCDSLSGTALYHHAVPVLVEKLLRDTKQSQEGMVKQSAS